jgi:UDPglucose--hexose-1-phosphate uridylyltransferase
MPNKPQPFFEEISAAEQQSLADAMCEITGRLYRGLKNPPYNYYIHSAPCDDTGFSCDLSTFQHFRWHIEILPRLSKIAGFELGTGIEINTAIPEESAAFLRDQR